MTKPLSERITERLAKIGLTPTCRISATAPSVILEGVTAVFGMTDAAATAWAAAPVQGR